MAIYTKVSGATQHPIEIHEHLANTIVSASGMVDETNDFTVTERTSPSLGVKVSTGRAWLVKSDNSISYPVRNDADVEDTSTVVSSNGTGNPRIDAVVLFYDEGAGAPQVDGTEVAKLQVVAGTAAASPTAPDNTAIVSAIGGSYPYTILAEVAVASGATTILDANITDVREKATVEAGASGDGWTLFEGTTLTFDSTTDGVDTLNSTDDLTSSVQVGEWCKITSGAGTDLIYKVKDVTASTIDVVGEVSVSGSITAMSFSKAHAPQGVIPWETLFLAIGSVQGQSIPSGTTTTAQCAEIYDPNSNFASYKYTIPVSGYWDVCGLVRFGATLANTNYQGLFSGISNSTWFVQNTGGATNNGQALAAKDYISRGTEIYLSVYQNSGVTNNSVSNDFYFNINFLGI